MFVCRLELSGSSAPFKIWVSAKHGLDKREFAQNNCLSLPKLQIICPNVFNKFVRNNKNVRYKPRVPGKPCTSHKNVGFLNLNAQQIHTAQKNNKLYCQGRARRKAPVFYYGF